MQLGCTPLGTAKANNKQQVVDLLVQHGAKG